MQNHEDRHVTEPFGPAMRLGHSSAISKVLDLLSSDEVQCQNVKVDSGNDVAWCIFIFMIFIYL